MRVTSGPMKGLALGEGPLAPLASTLSVSWYDRHVEWLADERAFDERHVSFYARVVVEVLDEYLYMNTSTGTRSSFSAPPQEGGNVMTAITFALPYSITLFESDMDLPFSARETWCQDVAVGVNRMRSSEEGLFEVMRGLQPISTKLADRHFDESNRSVAVFKIAAAALAYLVAGPEGLDYDFFGPTVYDRVTWGDAFQAHLDEAEEELLGLHGMQGY